MTDDFSSHVVVDLGELRDVATWLRREAEGLGDGRSAPSGDVHFGHHSPCGETHGARRIVASALDGYGIRLETHRRELASIADNLERAIAEYQDGDNLRGPDQ